MPNRIRAGDPSLRHRHPVLHEPGWGPDGDPVSPSPTQRAALGLTSRVLADLRSRPSLPSGKALGNLVLDTVAVCQKEYDTARLDRRLGVYAGSFAVTCLRFWHPAGDLVPLVDAVAGVELEPADRARVMAASGRPAATPRLAWTSRTGDLWLDELSIAHQPDMLTGPQTLRRIQALRTYGHLAPEGFGRFAGIRLLPPRRPDLARHVPATLDADSHPLGHCAVCVTGDAS